MDIISTRGSADAPIKALVYGGAGAGKTYLASTVQNAIILSAEAGLLSLRQFDIPAVKISTLEHVHEAYSHVRSGEYSWVVLDSVSEIAEVVLAYEKSQTRDPRKAYGALSDQMMDLLRAFRDLPCNVLMTAKQGHVDDDGRLVYQPMMPGQKLGQQLPYLFDEVFALRIERNNEGELERWLQTQSDGQYLAKDRSGALNPFVPPHLGDIAARIRSTATEEAA